MTEWNSQMMSNMTAISNLCQDGINTSMFLRIMRIRMKNDDDNYSWNKWATLNAVMIYHLILCIRNYNETLSHVFRNMLQAWFLKQEKLLKKVWPKMCHYLVILYWNWHLFYHSTFCPWLSSWNHIFKSKQLLPLSFHGYTIYMYMSVSAML